jgi:chaperone required for assembly of F1-ATPase
MNNTKVKRVSAYQVGNTLYPNRDEARMNEIAELLEGRPEETPLLVWLTVNQSLLAEFVRIQKRMVKKNLIPTGGVVQLELDDMTTGEKDE